MDGGRVGRRGGYTLLRHEGCEPATTLAAIQAFHAVRPSGRLRSRRCGLLVVLRGVVLVVSGIHQSAIDAETTTMRVPALEHEWRIFERANAIPLRR